MLAFGRYRDSYEIEVARIKLTTLRSIFIRGGESGFMTYCVKTRSNVNESLAESHSQEGGPCPRFNVSQLLNL